jgi:hypothetical protein
MKRIGIATLILLVVCTFGAPAGAQEIEVNLVSKLKDYMRQAETWSMKAVILIALGETNHPSAVPAFYPVLLEKDIKLSSFALKSLANMSEASLKAGMTQQLLERLIDKEVKVKHPHYRGMVMEILRKTTGENFTDKGKWWGWWRKNKDKWAPQPWDGEDAPTISEGGGSSGGGTQIETVKELFELRKIGLDMVFCIDATGSMMQPIQATKNGIDELTNIITKITPNFRIGVVAYRDLDDKFDGMTDGAMIVQPLTDKHRVAKAEIGKLKAIGGGDIAERVANGLEVALKSDEMGWQEQSEAKGKPLGKDAGVVYSGEDWPEEYEAKPIIVSTIGVPQGGSVASDTESHFKSIATSGGGEYASLDKAADIVKAILVISFSAEFKGSAEKFVDWYFEFREAKYFGPND